MRYALRSLLRTPGFTVAAILSIAIGVGANTAIYSVASALLLHPLPYRNADRLVILWNRSPGLGITEDWFSTAQYFDIKNGHGGFEELAIAIGACYNLTHRGDGDRRNDAQRAGAHRHDPHVVEPAADAWRAAALGRLFSEREDRAGAPDSAILHYGDLDAPLRRRSARSRSHAPAERPPVSNRRRAGTVVLAAARSDADARRRRRCRGRHPAAAGPPLRHRGDREDYNIIGRLKPGVSLRAAQAEMDAITARLRRDHPTISRRTAA